VCRTRQRVSDFFGWAVEIDDVTGDGSAEVLVGAPGEARGRGAVFMIKDPFGRRRGSRMVTGSDQLGAIGLGTSIVSGDFDRHGPRDLVVGSYYCAGAVQSCAPNSGAVTVFAGPNGRAIATPARLIPRRPSGHRDIAGEGAALDGGGGGGAGVAPITAGQRSSDPHLRPPGRLRSVVVVADDVDDVAVRVAHEEPSDAPRFLGQRVDDLVAPPLGLTGLVASRVTTWTDARPSSVR
jgi:hypothetical protein